VTCAESLPVAAAVESFKSQVDDEKMQSLQSAVNKLKHVSSLLR